MGSKLFSTFSGETLGLINCGEQSLNSLVEQCDDFIGELKLLEKEMEEQIKSEIEIEESGGSHLGQKLEEDMQSWYHGSIKSLKEYNNGINRYLKNILNNSKYCIDLDDAYTYPLNISNFPISQDQIFSSKGGPGAFDQGPALELEKVRQVNHFELLKAIILHLLKIGQAEVIKGMVAELQMYSDISLDEGLLENFKLLNEIVDDIVIRHDLNKVLLWFEGRNFQNDLRTNIEFQFHVLQFILLLKGQEGSNESENVLATYLYSKDNFTPFLKDHLHEISPLMTLLLLRTNSSQGNETLTDFPQKYMSDILTEFESKMRQVFTTESIDRYGKFSERQFISTILSCHNDIHHEQMIFVNLANDFIAHFCEKMNLSSDSSLFQAILSGFINLPSFYKFNRIQQKFKKISKLAEESSSTDVSGSVPLYGTANGNLSFLEVHAPFDYDLPFLLPDSSRFLFNYHPIFICPVSKEQLIPFAERNKEDIPIANDGQAVNYNPVVVLKHCNHLALKESIWQLSKKGTEVFKCHYCYKKHKLSEISEAFFIDL